MDSIDVEDGDDGGGGGDSGGAGLVGQLNVRSRVPLGRCAVGVADCVSFTHLHARARTHARTQARKAGQAPCCRARRFESRIAGGRRGKEKRRRRRHRYEIERLLLARTVDPAAHVRVGSMAAVMWPRAHARHKARARSGRGRDGLSPSTLLPLAATFSRARRPTENATNCYSASSTPRHLHLLLHLALARPYADVRWTTTFWVDVYVRSSSR